VDQNEPHFKTADIIAKETGVSTATIKRDGQYAEAVGKVAAVVPDILVNVSAQP